MKAASKDSNSMTQQQPTAPTPASRSFSLMDKAIGHVDRTLRTLAPHKRAGGRPSPATNAPEGIALNDAERQHAAGLMRVNHAGEVCAQALYHGQSLTAKLPKVREEMEGAAAEEMDHLDWCEDRLNDLGSQPSVLNPAWFGLSFGLGAVAGLISDKVSLGFVAATEEQVCKHLENHLKKLPADDVKSRAVVQKMIEEEKQHGANALKAGGATFPRPVKKAMALVSKVMTESSYRI